MAGYGTDKTIAPMPLMHETSVTWATLGSFGGGVDHPILAMYLDAVEQATREDIAAAAAAHRELGRDYDAAVA